MAVAATAAVATVAAVMAVAATAAAAMAAVVVIAAVAVVVVAVAAMATVTTLVAVGAAIAGSRRPFHAVCHLLPDARTARKPDSPDGGSGFLLPILLPILLPMWRRARCGPVRCEAAPRVAIRAPA